MQIAHDDQGQLRKATGARYWTHPTAVCEILEGVGASDDICAAALLHDTAEDTDVNYDDLTDTFGKHIADLVLEVTNTPGLDGMSKEDYMNGKLLRLSDEALCVKLADILANSSDAPRPQQLERMKRNIHYLLDNRHDLDDTHQQLISKIMDVFGEDI
jgi:(p)ppGpp synthase/HD superfamily hydrolase